MITSDNVKKLAKLTRLSLDDNKIITISNQLNEIEKIIDSLMQIDCSNIPPLTSVISQNIVMRSDEAASEDIREELFANCPEEVADLAKDINCFVVPKVIE